MDEASNKSRRFEWLTGLGVCIGVFCWLSCGFYSFYLWRITPQLPDKEHVAAWVQHGGTHYVSIAQHNFYSHFKTVAWVGLGASFVLGVIRNLLLHRRKPVIENPPV